MADGHDYTAAEVADEVVRRPEPTTDDEHDDALLGAALAGFYSGLGMQVAAREGRCTKHGIRGCRCGKAVRRAT